MTDHHDSKPLLQVSGLVKSYGDTRAVDGISFDVREGEIYGLLGPNGAGKTTTLSILSGVLEADEGAVTVDGIDLGADPLGVKARLGVVPQETALYEELSATENLRFWAGLYGLRGKRLDQAVALALERVGLGGRAKEPVKRFSGGMKRRLNLSLGLVHEPRLVLLDEPTVGIDPQARLNILEVIRDVAAGGSTVLYTTHYLEEAESLCDRIGILDHGKLLAEGSLEHLQELVGEQEVVTLRGNFTDDRASTFLAELDGVRLLSSEQQRLVLAAGGEGGAARLLQEIYGAGLEVDAVSIQPPSLNSLFLKLTGRQLRD